MTRIDNLYQQIKQGGPGTTRAEDALSAAAKNLHKKEKAYFDAISSDKKGQSYELAVAQAKSELDAATRVMTGASQAASMIHQLIMSILRQLRLG